MTTGDEPALGGWSEGNSPMISSVQTHVFASARGAYVTGNPRALIKLIKPEQKLKLRQFLVEGTLREMETFLADSGHRGECEHYVEAIRDWLNNPGETVHNRLADLRGTVDALPEYRMRRGLYHLMSIILKDDPVFYTQSAIIIIVKPEHRLRTALRSVVDEWLLESAWAFIRLKLPAIALATTVDVLEAVRADADRMHREARVDVLIDLMSVEQQHQFRQTLLTHTMNHVTSILAAQDLDQQERDWLQKLQALIRGEFTLERHELRAWYRQIADSGSRYFSAFCSIISAMTSFSLFSLALSCENTTTFVDGFEKPPGKLRWRPRSDTRRQVRHWQADAAWAILHDTPIPPLELEP
jgi:hypothetical protein